MLKGTNLKYAKSFNLRLVLETIRLEGPVSRAEIAKRTQLTAQTVTNITKKMMNAGLIYEHDRVQEGRGAPSILLKLNGDAAYSIGIDLDKDHLSCVLVDLNGKMRQHIGINLNFPTPDEAVELISENVEKLIKLEGIDLDLIWGVGVGLPGPLVISEGSIVTNVVNPQFFEGWDHIPVVEMLEKKLGLPVILENNASSAAIGERWYGDGKHIDNFFYIAFGAGLGGGVFINGQLHSGATGNAGELGYFPLSNDKYVSDEFEQPHLGMLFNLPLLYKRLNEEGFNVENPKDLIQLLEDKNSLLLDWLNNGARELAPMILAIEYLIDPNVIFIGGRLPEKVLRYLIEKLEEQLPSLRIQKKTSSPEIRQSTAGVEATALGAATLPLYTSFAPIPKFLENNGMDRVDSFKSRKIL